MRERVRTLLCGETVKALPIFRGALHQSSRDGPLREEEAQVNLSYDGTRASEKLYADFGCDPEQALGQCKVCARCEGVGIRNWTGKDEMPFSREVGERRLLNSYCAQSELLRANSHQDIGTIKPPGIGALCLDSQSGPRSMPA